MNLYLLSQNINNGYDTYDSCVVAAETESEAREIHPSDLVTHCKNGEWMGTRSNGEEYITSDFTWVNPSQINKITVEKIGVALNGYKGVICASFNAG